MNFIVEDPMGSMATVRFILKGENILRVLFVFVMDGYDKEQACKELIAYKHPGQKFDIICVD